MKVASDETKSDQTLLVNEEDWASSSAASDEPTEGIKSTVQMHVGASRKRRAAKVAQPSYQSQCEPVADKSRARESRAASAKLAELVACEEAAGPAGPVLLSSKEEELGTSGRAYALLATAQRALSARCDVLLQRAPLVQKVLAKAAANSRGVGSLASQAVLCLCSLLLLIVLEGTVPTVGVDWELARLVEIPLGLLMVFKFNQVGDWVATFCTPTAISAKAS